MEKFMNLPEEKSYTAEDVVADYKVYGDKKSVAKRYNLPVSEITKIFKEAGVYDATDGI